MRPLLSAKVASITGKVALVLAFWWNGHALAKQGTMGAGLVPGLSIQAPKAPFQAPEAKEDLYLAVFINGVDTKTLAAFHRFPGGCLTVSTDDLKEYRLKIPEIAMHVSGGVCLERMPGLTYRYDVSSQTIHLKVSDSARMPLDFDMRRRRPEPTKGHDLSAVLNYGLFAAGGTQDYGTNYYPQYQGASAGLDAHVFSQYGIFDQSVRLNSTMAELTPGFLRLDTRWTYEDPGALVTYTAGDVISGSLNWTTAIRMGGVQVRRNFRLRPDLVTMPLPQFSGSAAVPSSVEVYANQTRLFTQDVTGGPFNLNNIPLTSGPGKMRIVLRDANGKETVTEYAYYNSTSLLAPGLFDYSLEAGFARRFYGLHSLDYGANPIASGSVRYGVTPRLTVEGHAEGGEGLLNLGAAVDFGLWRYGIASFAFAGSELNGAYGGQGFGSFETGLWGARLMLRTQRALGDYQDLASVTAPRCAAAIVGCAAGSYTYKKRDQISFSIPVYFDEGSLNFSYTDSLDYDGNANKIGTLSYNRPFLFDRSTISVNMFNDFEHRDSFGAYASVSYSWDAYSTSAILEASNTTSAAGGSFSKTPGREPGSYGYALTALEGARPQNSAAVTYRGQAFQAVAGVAEYGRTVHATVQADGAIAFLNGMYFSNRIDNSFAVVDTGVPGARVLYENNPAGATDSKGRLLLANVRAHEANRIAIDPASLPPQAEMPETKQIVVPASRGGTAVYFKGNAAPPAAIVSFKDGNGKWLAAGSEAWVNGRETSFTVGLDGEAYLTGLAGRNAVLIKAIDGTPCNAEFEFTPDPEAPQIRIPGVVCASAPGTTQIAAQTGGETVMAKR